MKYLFTILFLLLNVFSSYSQVQTEKRCLIKIQKLIEEEGFENALVEASKCKEAYSNNRNIENFYGQILSELKSDYYHSNSDLDLFHEFKNIIRKELKKFPEDSSLIHMLTVVTYDVSGRLLDLEQKDRGIENINFFLSNHRSQASLLQNIIVESTLNLMGQNKMDHAIREIDLLLYSQLNKTDPDSLLLQILNEKLSDNDFASVDLLYKLLERKFPNQITHADQLICMRLTSLNSGDATVAKVKRLQQLSKEFRACKGLKAIEKEDLLSIIKTALKSNNYSKAGAAFRLAKLNFRNDVDILELKRQWVYSDYKANYKSQYLSEAELKWTGNIDNCEAGTVSQLSHQMVEDRVNYFRRLAGLRDSCKIDRDLNKLAQEAALIMAANNELSHFPGKNWDCYSISGYKGASKSNLSLGNHSIHAVTGQMQDEGNNNAGVGHRRWILYPELDIIGHGSTNTTQALLVIDKFKNLDSHSNLDFISWPPEHYVPNKLIYRRWSFSFDGADFENVRVEMKNNNRGVPLRLEPLDNPGGGDNSVVWIPDLSNTDRTKPYYVTIFNVSSPYLSRKERTFKYVVEILAEDNQEY